MTSSYVIGLVKFTFYFNNPKFIIEYPFLIIRLFKFTGINVLK
jgi:hypothetical protein